MLKAGELVAELGAQLGISLTLDENGVCRVLFDEDTVDFEASENTLYLIAELGPVLSEARISTYERLLRANYLGAETGGATLSLDPEHENIVILHRRLETPMAYPDFEGAVELFVKAQRYWKERITLHATENSSAGSTAPESFTMLRI